MKTRNVLAGVDIGGTKCAVCLGEEAGDQMHVLAKRRFATPSSPASTLEQIRQSLEELLSENTTVELRAIGMSCGGPLDSRRGLVLSPPNLPGWDEVDVLTPLRQRFGVSVTLQNDANAGALAEWRWGAGRGVRSLIFLTFGTGMGAGLILDGRLYTGANDMAGEVGHVRLKANGPIGYGKAGSFEGFCSGGGLAQLGRSLASEALSRGEPVAWCRTHEDLAAVNAERIGAAAEAGDPLARHVFERAGEQLGQGLAVLVDIFNPEMIVIGSIYIRQQALLEPPAMRTLQTEALPRSLSVCRIVPAALGEATGDLAALAAALE